MTLTSQLQEHVRACFTGLWITTHEPDEALAEIGSLCRSESWSLATWDIDHGRQIPNSNAPTPAGDPLSAVRVQLPPDEDSASLLVLVNFHRFLGSVEIIQTLRHRILEGKQTKSMVVILAPEVRLPPELEKLFVVLQHELPDREQLLEIARGSRPAD